MTEIVVPDQRRTATRARSLHNRVRYRFDNLLSRGIWAVLLWLGAITLLAVLLSSALLATFGVTFSGSEDGSWPEDFWQSLLRVLDPGTMAADVGWGPRVLSLLVTIFGLLIAGTLIGLIANGVEQRVEAMQRGRSTVVESGHVVILGASSRLSVVIEQLALGSRRRRGNTIVVLADREPLKLREDLRAGAAALHRSRLVLRWGDPTRTSDLATVGVRDARAVIVLADDDAQGDAGVVKAVLATGAEVGGFDRIPVIAELSDPEMGESLVLACGGAVHPVAAMQSVARITAFALREPGLNQVVRELLDFRGCDIYVRELGDLAGSSFADAVFRFDKARPIGRIRSGGEVEINPDPQTRLGSSDRLIVIADDNQVPAPSTSHDSDHAPLLAGVRSRLNTTPRQEHLLIIGWNGLGSQLLNELENVAAPGSSAELIYDPRLFSPEELEIPRASGLDITLTPGRSVTWQLDDEAQSSHLTSIMLLGYRRGISPEQADSRTLLNLMVLRRQLAAWAGGGPRVVVELLDAENVDLAQLTGADDYVVSDAVTSRLMAQLAEQPQRRAILLSLYAVDGPSIHLIEAAQLGLTGEVGCEQIVAAAYSCGLLALGWRRGGEVVLNPRNSERVLLEHDDQIVVIG